MEPSVQSNTLQGTARFCWFPHGKRLEGTVELPQLFCAEDPMTRRPSGFTLIEILIAIAIVGLLTSVAVPSYNQYITRSRTVEAFSVLGAAQAGAEQFWNNGRTYAGYTPPAATDNFTYALSNASPSTFTLTASGRAKMTGFTYTIKQDGSRATPATPSWGTSTTCWVDKKGGACSS
jgi:type IV pilus assembly protein PilE